MNGENQLLVTDKLVEVWVFEKITDPFRGIKKVYLGFDKIINWKMSTYHWLDLETLEYQPIMPQISPYDVAFLFGQPKCTERENYSKCASHSSNIKALK